MPSLIDSHLALAAKNNANRSNFGKKDRPLCSYCGVLGHTVDKCFKLHGYPPGFKAKSKNLVAQVVDLSSDNASQVSSISSTTQLTNAQCQQLIQLLSSQINIPSSSNTTSVDNADSNPTSGQVFFSDDWQG
ncbi:Zinc finger, CCHC-type superfamily [Sesbania bispinosa]|nr:Zinc finger, CCHC-type superfamily [Sesbania bispinosa]